MTRSAVLIAATLAAIARPSLPLAQQPEHPPAPADSSSPPTSAAAPTVAPPPAAEREFRGVWVASVANIDWPSRAGLSTAEQQRELIALLDRAAALHLNAVIFQVRPAADALYASALEPWSEYLTGRQGVAPSPYYDPLTFAVAEAHRRGLELHAWFNPYRARHPSAVSPAARSHISRRHPELVHPYGTKQQWMDPGEAEVRRHSLRVILDVVTRYDVDGVHIDDYFYPYPEPDRHGRDLPFPDDRSWRRYRRGGGELSRDDWRRHNVDVFIRELYTEVKRTKSWVRVGISPFGIWRPGSPPTVRGLDAYTKLYADSRKWLVEGWLDYIVPQLYWPVAAREQGYAQLLDWWGAQNARGRHLYAGNFTAKVGAGGARGWSARELLDQIAITRVARGAAGNVHFSMSALLTSRDSLVERLMRGAYASQALVPASTWLGASPPPSPAVTARFDPATGVTTLGLTPTGPRSPALWLVRARLDTAWTTVIVPGDERSYAVLSPTPASPVAIAVSAVDRVGNESAPTMVRPTAPATPEPPPAPSVTPTPPATASRPWSSARGQARAQ
ncbi:MAG: family 10 glycosylhydrolase [Gemmatimonadaceae bacterium]